MEIFSVLEDGLSEPAVATMVEGIISTSDLPSFVLDCLFDSFCEETVSDDDDVRNYDDIGKLSNETDRDSGNIFDRYLDTSDDKKLPHETQWSQQIGAVGLK